MTTCVWQTRVQNRRRLPPKSTAALSLNSRSTCFGSIFTPCWFNLIQPEERLWSCFALFLEKIFSRNWAHVLSSRAANFQPFYLKCGEKFNRRKKQTRQDIKIRRHGFWDKGVKNAGQCLSLPLDHFRLYTNWILQAMYFCKTIAIFSRHLSFFVQ